MFDKDEKFLNTLKPGQSGYVSAIQSFPNDRSKAELRFKLLALGLVPGTVVHVKCIAPFGDPITIEVRGTRISLRKIEASIISLKDVNDSETFENLPINLNQPDDPQNLINI